MSAARDRLTAAALARVEALKRRDEAAETLARASRFAGEIERELDALRAVDQADTEANADDIVEALKAGATPTFTASRPIGASTIAIRDAERRLAAAKRATDSLSAEHKRAASALAEAEAKHEIAVRDVVIAEGSSIAERVEKLEAEALVQRTRLGGRYGRLSQSSNRAPAALARVLATSDFQTNTPPHIAAMNANGVWARFIADLGADPNATLTFGADAPA